MSEDLRFPIGPYEPDDGLDRQDRIDAIRELPRLLRLAVEGLNDVQLDTPYRPGGWTVRQTVHHLADSHMNSFCRFRLALTEETPTIRPYYEERWATLPDSSMPVEPSLEILDGLHLRWAFMLDAMSEEDFRKTFRHPDSGSWHLEDALGLYAWHSRHHTAHITATRERYGW
jgi:hypothetical protein